MFVSTAWAQGAGAGGGDMFGALMPLVLIFVVFYFLLIRPQQKKQKTHQAKLEAIRRGDKIMLGGGIYGTVTKVQDSDLTVEIAEGVKVSAARATVLDVLTKPEPAAGGEQKKGGAPANDEAAKGGGILGKFLGRK